MRKYFFVLLSGFVLAVIAVMTVTPGSWSHYRLMTRQFNYEGETAEVLASLRLFSATYASFYMTGGSTDGLNTFPAEQMVKRRIFMDISNYMAQGTILVTDRDDTRLREISFLTPTRAVTVTDEDWYFLYRDAKTRRSLSTRKFNPLTVRYYLKKEWGKWIVLDYDVFDQGETLPPAPVEKIVRW